jgi:biopolymer transport protein ExbB/TolQ
MRRVIDEETASFESGLTVLASIGSTAPFIGLFGTVWGPCRSSNRYSSGDSEDVVATVRGTFTVTTSASRLVSAAATHSSQHREDL